MEIKIQKEMFLKEISKFQSIVIEKKDSLPILANILLEAKDNKIISKATNLDIGLISEEECEVIKEGSVVVPEKGLFDIVRELPDESVNIKKIDNNWIQINCGKSMFKIVGMDPEEYPQLPVFKMNKSFDFKRDDFLDMMKKTSYSISTDETRTNLIGAFFEKIVENDRKIVRMVSSDGHRISKVDREVENWSKINLAKGVILPRKGIVELKRLLEEISEENVNVTIELNHFILKSEKETFMMRLLEGEFPDYSKAIPQTTEKEFIVSKEEFTRTLKRVSAVSYDAPDRVRYVNVNLNENILEITSNNPKLGEAREEIKINYPGKSLSIGFNARYFLESLNVIDDDNVRIKLQDELSPGLIFAEKDSDYMALIMPIRI